MPAGEKFGSLENLPSITADLVMVIEAWPFLTDEAKKDILVIVRQKPTDSRGSGISCYKTDQWEAGGFRKKCY